MSVRKRASVVGHVLSCRWRILVCVVPSQRHGRRRALARVLRAAVDGVARPKCVCARARARARACACVCVRAWCVGGVVAAAMRNRIGAVVSASASWGRRGTHTIMCSRAWGSGLRRRAPAWLSSPGLMPSVMRPPVRQVAASDIAWHSVYVCARTRTRTHMHRHAWRTAPHTTTCCTNGGRGTELGLERQWRRPDPKP